MVASTDIKWFSSDNLNAPQLTNDWGVMIGVLDACLINGLSIQSVASLTISGAIATATFNSAHQYKQYQVIEIAGAMQPEYNGQHRILTVPTANSITFELIVVPSANTATGTMTCRLPPLRWTKPFGDVGRAAYRSATQPAGHNKFLRVVDSCDPAYNPSYAKYAKVGIVEDMTDIDSMLGVLAPFDVGAPDKNWVATGSGATVVNGWAKWYWAFTEISGSDFNSAGNGASNDATPPVAGNRSWYLIGNQDAFYLFCQVNLLSAYTAYGFGRFDSFFDGDIHNTFLGSTLGIYAANEQARQGIYNGLLTNLAGLNTICIARPVDSTPLPDYCIAAANKLDASGKSNVIASTSILGGIQSTDVLLFNSTAFRGRLPLIKWLYQDKPYGNGQTFAQDDAIFLALNVGVPSTANTALVGQIIIKVGE